VRASGAAVVLVVVVAAGAFRLIFYRSPILTENEAIDSVAVLPFANASGEHARPAALRPALHRPATPDRPPAVSRLTVDHGGLVLGFSQPAPVHLCFAAAMSSPASGHQSRTPEFPHSLERRRTDIPILKEAKAEYAKLQ